MDHKSLRKQKPLPKGIAKTAHSGFFSPLMLDDDGRAFLGNHTKFDLEYKYFLALVTMVLMLKAEADRGGASQRKS